MSDHLLSWLRLARLPGIGPVLIKRLLDALLTPEAILNAHPASLASIDGIGTHRANQIVTHAAATEKTARDELNRAQENRITILTQSDPRYPPALKTIPDPPILLYARGELLAADALAIGIVGARQCTLYGREQANRFGHDLANTGFTVISGGARGIDTASHLGALRAKAGGGRTVVVQGCGLLHTYPPENKDLYDRIVREDAGAIISELPLDTPPTRENFPPRNRIIAGMSLGVLVIEANLRSGSLITARLAAADYNREVFALPGRVDSPASAGTHHLIKSGSAHLIESVEDLLTHLGHVGEALQQQPPAPPEPQKSPEPPQKSPGIESLGTPSEEPSLFPSTPITLPAPFTSLQQKILNALPPNGATIDDLLESTRLAPPVLMAELTMLQIRGTLTRHPGNRFARS
ncbi:MAG TPA: DNA-processing protein DprA [Phycisphaerae bacterium]|nr:DNA-processing protein DprA [Phycisphaerae bacterium]